MPLMRFHFTISHVPGKDLSTADTLSRSPVQGSSFTDEQFNQEVEAYVHMVCENLPASDQRISQIKQLQLNDEVCQQLIGYCRSGWPDKRHVPGILKPYYSVAGEISF